MHPFGQQLGSNVAYIVDFGNCNHSITAEVGIYDNRLRVGVAYHSDALTSHKPVEVVLEFRAEIITFYTMNGTVKTHFRVESYQSGTFCTKVRIIVSAVKEVIDTRFVRDCSEKSSHCR